MGHIRSAGAELEVTDTKKEDGVYIHICTVRSGDIHEGDSVTASVCPNVRAATERNHSAAHLLQGALRKVLGSHVEQQGSYVDRNEVRFDFSHFASLTAEELSAVETEVNRAILEGVPVVTVETDVESARAAGAMALFGEKYGKTVRMVKMGGYSTELCGGTHVDNTAKIGLFRIVSESSVAAGVRRICGVTGLGVLTLLDKKEKLISDTAKALKAGNPADAPARAAQLGTEVSALKKEIEALNSKIAGSQLDSLLASGETVGTLKLCTADLGNAGVEAARALGDKLRDKDPSAVAVLAIHDGAKLNFIACCGSDAVKAGAHAGRIVGAVAAVCGGKGGGRPDSAMSGGSDVSKVPEALKAAKDILSSMLK